MADHHENKAETSSPASSGSHSCRNTIDKRKKEASSEKKPDDDACTKANIVSADKKKTKKRFTAPLMRKSWKKFELLQSRKPHVPVVPRPKPACPVVVKPVDFSEERLAEVCHRIKSKERPIPKKAILFYDDSDPLKIKTTAAPIFKKPAQDQCGSSSKVKESAPEKGVSTHSRSTANKASQSAPQDCRPHTSKTSAALPSARGRKRAHPTEESTVSKKQRTGPSATNKVAYKRTISSDDEEEGVSSAKRPTATRTHEHQWST